MPKNEVSCFDGKRYINYFNVSDETLEKIRELCKEDEENNKELKNPIMTLPIWTLSISSRAKNALMKKVNPNDPNIQTIHDLIQKTPRELLKIRNFGQQCLVEVQEALYSLGLQLKNDD